MNPVIGNNIIFDQKSPKEDALLAYSNTSNSFSNANKANSRNRRPVGPGLVVSGTSNDF